jgi:O-antigen/teichoic acid export membrane protein
MMIAGVGLTLVLCLGAEFAVDLVAGPGLERSVDVLRVLSVALVGTFVIAARGYALLALDRTRAILVSNAVALTVVAAAGAPLIHAYGALGAAIALVAAELALAMSYELALTAARPELRVPVGFALRISGAALLSVVMVATVDVPSVAMAIIGAAIYCAALLVLRVIPAELWRSVWTARAGGSGVSPR